MVSSLMSPPSGGMPFHMCNSNASRTVPVCEDGHPLACRGGRLPYLGRKGGAMTQAAERRAVVRCVFCQTPNRVDLTKLSLGPKCANCHRPILLDRPLKVAGADFDQTLQGTTVPVAV